MIVKALIWFLVSFFGYAVPITTLKKNGIHLGGIPTFIYICVVLGTELVLCRLYDDRLARKKRAIMTEAAKKEGMTFEEYALKDAPSDFIEICEHYKGKNEDIKNYLTSCKDSGAITKDAYIVYYNYYRK